METTVKPVSYTHLDVYKRQHVQILKTAHHGSKGSSSPGFLGKMPLKAAFISYGKDNSYGHPSPAVTEQMKKQNISFYETGGNGAWILENKDRKVIDVYKRQV